MVLASPSVIPVVNTPHNAPIPGILIQGIKITTTYPGEFETAPSNDKSPRQHLRRL
jgi:hypothetical protein